MRQRRTSRVTGLRHDDFKPYLWKTTDYGQTWVSIAGNLPTGSVNAIAEDRKNPNLLFVGTDIGLYVTLDGGKVWTRMKNGIPTNPVHDLLIHSRENELVVATHGRGVFIADVTPLQGLTPQAMNADAILFDIQPAVQWVNTPQPVTATSNINGQSRPAGVAINYYLKSAAAAGSVTVRVYDGTRLIAETPGPVAAGIQTVRWNMQARRTLTEAERAAAAGRGGRGGRGGGGGAGGRGGRGGGAGGGVVFPAAAADAVMSTVTPGEYRVVLSVGGKEYSHNAMILADSWYK